MSDDRSDRPTTLTRRRALAALSSATLAGIAGCAGAGSKPNENSTTNGTSTITKRPTTTEGTTTTPDRSLYSGDTIPPVTYDEMASQPPTVAAPATGVDNPVLTADDVTDFGDVSYVADPYIFVEEGTWHLFFEVVSHNKSPNSAIGHATSDDGLHWDYDRIVIKKGVHSSFPFVFKYEGEYYMNPASGESVELWKAKSFPHEWEHIGTPVKEDYYTHDPVYFKYNDRWWIFTTREDKDVMIYHAPELSANPDDWSPHSQNPVVTDRKRAAREGGRPIVMDDSIYLFFQDLEYEYGDQIRAYRVTELTPDSYEDEEVEHSPVVAGFGSGWNQRKMHQFDPWSLGEDAGWRCAVDGAHGPSGNSVEWGIGIFDAPQTRQPDPSAIPYEQKRTSGYFRFDDQSGVVVDDSGNRNHGMLRGTSATKVGGCPGRRFANDSDRAVFPTKFEAMSSNAFTLYLRGKLRSPQTPQTLFTYTSRHVERRLAARYEPDTGGWQFDLHGTDDHVKPVVSSSVSPDEPFELAITYLRGDGFQLIQDGTKLTTARDVGDVFHEVCLPVVGSTLVGQLSWQGDVSHFGVFDDALTPETLGNFSVCSSK